MGQSSIHPFPYGCLRNSLIFWNKFLGFLHVHMVSCCDRPSRPWLVLQVDISAAAPLHLTEKHTVPMSTVYSP
jgi:hypothetical protein